MRHYHKGVLVGEKDSAPTTTIEQWARQELSSACSKVNVVISSDPQLMDNASLNGRIGALADLLHEIEKRKGNEDG